MPYRKTHHNFTRDERKAQIKRLLNDGLIRSTWDICRALDVAPSTHFRNILLEMHKDELISAYSEPKGNKVTFYWYIQKTLPLPLEYENVT